MIWLKNLDTHEGKVPAFSKIAKTMAAFRQKLNVISKKKGGNKSLLVDEEEVLLTRFDGASMWKQKYRRHKDSYTHDENNKINGKKLRKLSLVIFLNDNLDKVRSLRNTQDGILRLYPNGENVEGVVDISPRLGRAVLFKSEEMLH